MTKVYAVFARQHEGERWIAEGNNLSADYSKWTAKQLARAYKQVARVPVYADAMHWDKADYIIRGGATNG